MDQKYLAFDIEIAKEIPEGETDWKAHRPLGISCAATLASDQGYAGLGLRRGRPWATSPASKMRTGETRHLIGYLMNAVGAGYTVVTWNGLGFDFDVLAEEGRKFQECRDLALGHVDMMFHLFCLRGHALGLDKAAKGMGLAGKTEGMSGALAPKMWAEGRYREVLDYVAQDVRTTLGLAQAVDEAGYLEWVSRAGNVIHQEIDRWLTVRECLELPEPDTSWMTDPWPRKKFAGWLSL